MRFIFFVFAFILSGFSVWAQPPKLSVRYFSREDGLLNTYVNHVAQDSIGYIWVATREGLFRYNGYAYRGYYSSSADSTTITGNFVNYLFADSKGRLWVATSSGLCYYNREKDNFIRVADQKHPMGMLSMNIFKVSEDASGRVLVNNGNSILKYNETGDFEVIKTVNSANIKDFAIDKFDNLWLGLDGNQGVIRFNEVNKTENSVISGLSVSSLNIVDNVLWIATNGQGIKSFDIIKEKIISYPFNNRDDAMAIYVTNDRKGLIWTVDYTGLKLAIPESVTLIGYYPVPGNLYSVSYNVKGIFEDKQGNYWIYHDPGGVGVSMRLKGFRHFDNNPSEVWHTSNSNITAVHIDASGNLWMGFHEGGIDVFEWQKNATRRYQYETNNKYSLGRGTVLCIFRDSKGVMWVSTYFDGLQYFDEKRNRFISVLHNPDNLNSPAGNDIRSIVEDKEGNLWLAVHSKGIDKFNRKNNTFEHFNNIDNKLSNDWPFQLIIDRNDNLWVGTAWGLNKLKKGSHHFQNYISMPGDSRSLTGDLITSLHEDHQGNVWVGTSMGLNRYDSINDNFIQYINEFASDYVCAIQSDKRGNIWLSTLSGISRIDPENKIINFDISDGLLSNEFNGRSSYISTTDEMFFGGTKGIDIFYPDELTFNETPPVVLISKLFIFNKEITPDNSDILNKHISVTPRIRLHHTDKVITFNYIALNFINPQKNQYAYRLEGFEDEWHYVGQTREATYTNIDPGKYTFRVIAANNDGVWNTEGVNLQITVLPPWYRTLVFKLCLLLALLFLSWLISKIRTFRWEKQRLLLEKTVKEKTASLVEANHELQKYNNTKDKLFSLISHDLVSPFNTIIGFSEILKEGYDQLDEDEKRKYIGLINESSEKVYVLLNNLLVWSRSQTNRISCNPGAIRLKSLIDEVLELNAERLKVKNIKVKVECPSDLQVMADLEMLKTIIRNLFSNAMKFTLKSGNIHISVKPENTRVIISVIDSGIGMSREKIDELLSETLVDSENGTDGESGTGFGLSICRDFIRRNNGELSISSEPGKGSNFSFSLPIATT